MLALPLLMKRPNGPIRALKLRFVPDAAAFSVSLVTSPVGPTFRKKAFWLPVRAEVLTATSSATFPSEESNVIV